MKKIFAILVACIVGISTVACGSNDLVAKVNGEGITTEQFEQELKFNKWLTELRFGSDSVWEMMKAQNPDYQTMMKNQVLEQLIRQQEFLEYAKKNGVKPDEKSLKEFKDRNKQLFSNKKTKESFEKTGLTEKFMNEYAEKAALMGGLSNYLLKKAEPTKKQMMEFYKKNNKKVDASHILISTIDQKTGKPLDEKQKQEAKELAEKVYNKAKNGADFAALAKKYSQDPGSKDKGGELGVFGRGAMVPPFENAAFSMKAGEISKPVESQFGYHIIKVNKVVIESFKDAEPQIKQQLIQKNMQDLIQNIAKDAKVEKFENKVKEVPFGPTGSPKKKTEKKSTEKKSNEKKSEDTKKEDKK